ncbi:MAG: tRNA pseudouridine(55) synthase TruB [Bacilli bacterium]
MKYNGLVLLDKKRGQSTTREEVGLKRIFSTKKVGHAGTLDPFATGLIICGVNKGTKLLNELESADKTYVAKLKLGIKTTSADITGDIIERKEVEEHSEQETREVLSSFQGESMQLPPMYSALKIDGVPLYKLARKNQIVERKKRKINIKEIEFISYDKEQKELLFIASVSKGTYIRTLGEDIAKKMGEVGTLVELRRTRVGRFSVKQAKKIEDIKTEDIIDISRFYSDIYHLKIDGENAKRARNGADIKLDLDKNVVLLVDADECAIALYKNIGRGWFKVVKEFV